PDWSLHGAGPTGDLGCTAGQLGYRSLLLALHVQDDGGIRPGAADEHLPVIGGFQRLRRVADITGQQWRGARVAYPGPAAPPGGDVAGVGQVEHAARAVVERGGDARAGEGHQRPAARWSRWLVRWPAALPGDAGVDRGQCAEQLGMDAGRIDPDGSEGLLH